MIKSTQSLHIAIIMDGNGRWAKEHNLTRTAGHEKGALAVRKITQHCAKIGIKVSKFICFFNRKLVTTKDRNKFFDETFRKLFKKRIKCVFRK